MSDIFIRYYWAVKASSGGSCNERRNQLQVKNESTKPNKRPVAHVVHLSRSGSGATIIPSHTKELTPSNLLCQALPSCHFVRDRVYLHGLTADIALPDTGYQSFIASDVIANIGKAYLSVENKD